MDIEINERIKAIRKSKRITQRSVAKLLGLNYDTYYRREKSGTFSIEELKKIANFLSVSFEYLIHGENKSGDVMTFSDANNESHSFYNPKVSTTTFKEQELLNMFRQITQLTGSNKYFNEEITKAKAELEKLKKGNAK